VKITRIETVRLADTPYVLYVRVHTDEGLVGTGDTFMMAEALEGYIHGRAAPKLLGKDPTHIQRHWTALYDNDAARFGGLGIEVRAISAIDVALWDILGQSVGRPIYQLLGGASRDRVPIYNTCGGPAYGRPPYEVHGRPGPLEDLHTWNTRPEDLAAELLAEGVTAMKIWPFDDIGIANQGLTISAAELEQGLAPVRRIRDGVGSRMKIMIEGHGFWRLPAAIKIARALEDYDIEWIEDMLLAHDIGAIADLHAATTVPVLASEYLVTRHQYLPLLERHAADIIMLDPTWTGGITESHKIGALADSFGLPVTMHDCTGPFTLLAGVHLALAAPNATYQETVRAYIRTWYRDVVPHSVVIEDGHILPPTEPGIGTSLLPDVLTRADATVVSSEL
jgi:L-alanine-DL-glutamate epimerase-like enolase superfamily enzyme